MALEIEQMKLLLENWREYVKQEVESFLPHGRVRDINMIGSSTLSPEEQDQQDMEKYGHIQVERDIDIEVQIADITREEAEEWAFSNEAERLETENNYDVQLTIVENWREYLNEEDMYYVDAISENDEYCPVCVAALEEEKKSCKPSKGKRFAKRVDGKCRSFGQAGQAKSGGDRIRPGTAKGDAYCARSAGIKKCKNPPCANTLSRKKWKCRGKKSVA